MNELARATDYFDRLWKLIQQSDMEISREDENTFSIDGTDYLIELKENI